MISFAGAPIQEGEFKVERAHQFHQFVALGQPDVTYIGACTCPTDLPCSDYEFVIVSIRTRLPQRPREDVREEETFAIGFNPLDRAYPLVLSLREDFPDTLHVNRSPWEVPRSLCISDLPWPEAQLSWTPFTLVHYIKLWLRNAALGENHAMDQPLEPIFLEYGGDLILPSDFIATSANSKPYSVATVWQVPPTFRLQSDLKEKEQPQVICVTITAPLQQHQRLSKPPLTIAALAVVLNERGVDLYDELRKALREHNSIEGRAKKLVIVVVVPLSRVSDREKEAHDIFAAVTLQSIGEIGRSVGLWEPSPIGDTWAVYLVRPLPIDSIEILLALLRPHQLLNAERAARHSGRLPNDSSIVAIGIGAIGSQVIDLLSRSGFRDLTLVDYDKLLPHNVARHALPSFPVGRPKALSMKTMIEANLSIANSVGVHIADFCNPGESASHIETALHKADLVLDFSASLAVARKLARSSDIKARKVSFFINPSGTDSVLIAEPEDGSIGLDALEMQYYRGICSDPVLKDHLQRPVERVLVSRSCRDHTLVIPNEMVSLHAAIGAHAIHALIRNKEALIHVWHADAATMATQRIDIQSSLVHKVEVNGWTLSVDDRVLRRLSSLRESKLPVETGGILIGGVDTLHKRLYVVEVVGSPPDSIEESGGYVRGVEGLASIRERFGKLTDFQLDYVGEWHSHPLGCKTSPSEEDSVLMTKLKIDRAKDCLPALMAIVGDNGRSSWYFDSVNHSADLYMEIVNT